MKTVVQYATVIVKANSLGLAVNESFAANLMLFSKFIEFTASPQADSYYNKS